MPLNADNIFTLARKSLWDAIDNWPVLKSAFGHKFKMEDDNRIAGETQGVAAGVTGFEPSIKDLPAILIFPANISPAWYTNQQMDWPVSYQITIWTKDWDLRVPEQFVDAVAQAFHQCTASGEPGVNTVSYVKAATGRHPERIGPISFVPGRIGGEKGVRVIRTQLQYVLFNNRNPLVTG